MVKIKKLSEREKERRIREVREILFSIRANPEMKRQIRKALVNTS